MITFSLITNVSKNKVTSDFLADLSKLISQKLKKSELHVIVKIKAGQQFFWYESESPCGIGSFSGTGICGLNENKYYASFLYDILEKELGISQTRLYISFVEEKPSNIGVCGTTLEDLIQ